jgi:hypothetical protein
MQNVPPDNRQGNRRVSKSVPTLKCQVSLPNRVQTLGLHLYPGYF